MEKDPVRRFLERGGLWVATQFILLMAVFALSVIYQGGVQHDAVRWAGVTLLIVSGLCLFAGFRALGRQLTPFPKPADGGKVVQGGVYGWVRHPIYTGVLAGVWGWAVYYASWPGLVLAVVCVAFFDAKARREEAWLTNKYPEYAGYARQVSRFIPFLY